MQRSSDWVVLNGNLHPELSPEFFLKNRAFRLGDGFFETLRVIHGSIHLWDAHYARIKACCKVLGIEIPTVFSSDYMRNSIYKLLENNGINSGGRVRITLFREGEGTYKPETNRLGYVVEAKTIHQREFLVKDQGISIDVYTDMHKSFSRLSPFKLMGNHVYIQAAVWAQANNLSDALIINDQNRIIEATSSNVFIVKNGAIHTPAVDSGCVGGVMRMAVINAAIRDGIPIYESEIDINDITFADEVFLTNAVSGISWVGSFRNKRYYHKLSDRLVAKINRAESVDA